MLTYSQTIGRYTDTVESGHSDADLSAPERTLLVRLLRVVACGGGSIRTAEDSDAAMALAVVYPPSDRSRDDVQSILRETVRRSLVRPEDIGLDYAQWDSTIARAAEILRNV